MTTPNNGLVYKDGKWYMQCGPELVPVVYKDKDGRIVQPEEIKVSDS